MDAPIENKSSNGISMPKNALNIDLIVWAIKNYGIYCLLLPFLHV